MKIFIIVIILIIIASSEIVKPAQDTICTCDQINSENDCQAISTCVWSPAREGTSNTSAKSSSCELKTNPTVQPTSIALTYCQQITNPVKNCWKTFGCAYLDGKCTHFAGCTAYVKTTDQFCQEVSYLCITDGTQCKEVKSCNEKTVQTECISNINFSGTQKCKWENNACREQVCTDADTTLATNTACNAWLPDCVTTGKGCTSTLGACNSYTGDSVACSGLIGYDGDCEGTVGGTNCSVILVNSVRDCKTAASTIITDADCQAYQSGCITNGKGCVDPPLPACAFYTGDNNSCVGYLGSDGTCEGDAGAKNCRARICTNASVSNNTDLLCNAYKPGCVTMGKGCVASRGPCSGYSGTTASCLGLVGSDGQCKGTNVTTSSPCVAKECSEAPTTTSTDAACNLYQIGCKTIGKGCSDTRGPCSGYSGTTTSCEGYIGSDGKCKGVLPDITGPCTPRICTEAPLSTSTNASCDAYQTGCVTTGSGCVALAGCLDAIQSITCKGSTECVWNNICIASQYCSDFLTTSICNGNNAINGSKITPCYWTGSQCRNLACTDAPTIYNTDAQCNTFLSGCVTQGNGCLDPTAPCYSYVGTKATCSALKAKCWNTDSADTTTACTERACSDDTTSTTDTACNSFKTGCRTKGTGCIDGASPCALYQGIAVKCDTFRQVVGSTITRCYNFLAATATTSCKIKMCTDNTSATADADCETFLPGCLTNGTGCLPSTSPCSSYRGTQATCSNFKGSSGAKVCWNSSGATSTSNCKDKECSDQIAGTYTDADCGTFLPGCLTTGTRCVTPTTPCTSYTGNITQCAAFTGDSKKCYNTDPCTDRLCVDKISPTNNDDCKNYLSTCRYFNATCVNAGACTSYAGTSLALCQDVLDTSNNKCWWTGSKCTSRSCNTVPNSVTTQAGCDAHVSGCVYAGSGSCVIKGTCIGYTANGTLPADKLANCSAMIDINSKACFYVSGANCVSKLCSNVPGTITAQSSCDAHVSGCMYNGATCVDKSTCSNYAVTGTDAERLTKCQSMTDVQSKPCWWTTNGSNCQDSACAPGSICAPAGSCSSYNVSAGSNSANRTICEGIQDIAGTKVLCAYVDNASQCSDRVCTSVSIVAESNCIAWIGTSCRWDGTSCLIGGACGSYVAQGGTDDQKKTYCKTLTNIDDTPLSCGWAAGPNCTDRNCGNVFPAPTTDSDCQTYSSFCRLTNTPTASCIAKTSTCSQFTGTAAQCKIFRGDSDTTPCWSVAADNAAAAACIDKFCTLNTTATTNAECNFFLTGCKTKGIGCVASTTACSTFQGNASTCAQRISSDGTNNCKVGNSVSDSCTVKSCDDDGTSTTNASCQSFMPGCVTRGMGCVPSTEPCSIYQGTQDTCSQFTGNSKKCWNTATATGDSFCVDKRCSDDETSTTNSACNSSQNGCVTKGTGCIEASAACGAYQGTQATCSAFRGNSTVLCWNIATATATTPCIEKACSHNTTATSDADCETFLPRTARATNPKCVTSGTGCVDYPRSCEQFHGTLEQCGKFKATDGPCKTTASGTCTPRICSEALNSNNTDDICKAFHPTCVTTGYGCASSVSCSMIQEKNSCAAKSECSWVSNCRSIETDCSALTAFGASICVNTPVSSGSKKCSWQNDVCRAQTCDDLSATIVSHNSCKKIISTCTTTGSGCITIGLCSEYATEVICKAAKTSQIGNTCIWDNNACRTKNCYDAPPGATTDAQCDTYLPGCKTNGIYCVTNVTCSTMLTAVACQVDENRKPCLFVNNQCHSYARCEDAVMTNHSACQQFSPLCTTDGEKCIPIILCGKTVLQISCVVGTNGICGWVPANGVNAAKCQKFGACSDVAGVNNVSCAGYGSKCITDGIKCFDKSTCSTYLTQISCDNGGTDGVCQFITKSNSCRLRECTDATDTNASRGITSHTGCYHFTAKTKCTTNGTSCIAFRPCSSYSVEVGCVEGTDGLCAYGFQIGKTTGIKECRIKACQDIQLDTSAACSVALTGDETGCVSDGFNCIAKARCSSYTSKEACNEGGTDGECAFTPSGYTPTVGTCKLMSACTDANNDSLACYLHSSACRWLVSTSGTTTTTLCNAHTCSTKATGSTCNSVPSFDRKSYTICGPATTGGCTEAAGNTLLATTCQLNSMKTYTWDERTSICTACFTGSSASTDPGSTTGETTTGGTTSTDGNIIKLISTLIILVILVT